MLPVKKILCPTDLGEALSAALNHTIEVDSLFYLAQRAEVLG